MADDNVDVRFLGEQLARVLTELADVRAELAEIKEQTKLLPEVAAEVARLGVQAEDIKESVGLITHDIADLKTIFVDVQARIVRNEKRVQKLEKARPDA